MTLTVHIERLVIDAAPGQPLRADQLADAIRGELAERIAAGGVPAQLQSSSMRPSAPAFASASASAPAPASTLPSAPATVSAPGSGIGHALYGSLNR